ncbi:pimeloyl-ACP methyl ester carboxylesterase [Deinococcus sp. HSC-46F16]|uniref:alpha/beta hydrolase n=1 Tax=Deinococcus sp. HSC-46F16 TaxID=2910968 RepID=UPI0020A0847E|nr:alpha/beta fold hydrolase [Deinococcus sp. HSC-46F16]MCP2013275.1 pimeloyl-ACP methyl ester carboxylesterase [Deinococcus sp. HSC-46F16]
MRLARLLPLTAALLSAPALAASREVTLEVPGARLAATLQTPDGPQHARPPAALILAGSGPTDRDGNNPLSGPGGTYRKLAANLAARGIATLRPDKRGIGASTLADPREEAQTFEDFVNDARAWLTWLSGQPDLGPVAVIGHSEGGTVALAAVQGQTPARAVVLLAAPGEDIGSTIRRQIGQNPANPPALVEESGRILDALGRGERVSEVSPVLAPLFRPSVQPYLISSLRYDPQRLIASQNLPTLIVQGDRDLQVRPEDARLLSAAQPAARTHLARGVNHVLVPAPLDPAANFARYADAELPLERGVVTAVVEFLRGALR